MIDLMLNTKITEEATMRTAIKMYDHTYDVDERGSARGAIKEPHFFQRVNGRKRETFTEHRGCLITSFTASGTGWKARRHVPYLVCHRDGVTLCLSTNCENMRQAKRAIDNVLDGGIARV